MSEIKVGEFVKTKNGIIAKVIDKDGKLYWFDRNVYKLYDLALDHIKIEKENKIIIKHSENILDLIEVGDYVNGIKVLATTRFNEDEIGICVYKDNEDMHCTILKKENIKSIVTKEQFEQVEYRIEEEK